MNLLNKNVLILSVTAVVAFAMFLIAGVMVASEIISGLVRIISIIIMAISAIACSGIGAFTYYHVAMSREKLLTERAKRRLLERDADSLIAPRDSQIYVNPRLSGMYPLHMPKNGATNQEIALWCVSRGQSLAQLGDGTEQPVIEVEEQWPEKVDLFSLLPNGEATLSNIVLGVTRNKGKLSTVASPLVDLTHIICAGSSGWGKSVFIRSIAYQLATAPEDCELILMDREGITFSAFNGCNKLLHPPADEDKDMINILNESVEEMERRRTLYHQYPTAERLDEYNQLAPDPLSPRIVMIDEATTLLNVDAIADPVRTLSQRARKYGIFLLLAGQSMRADVVTTDTRDQFNSIIQLKANSPSQSRILIHSGVAHSIKHPGRGYVILSGREMLEMQSPYLTPKMINGDLSHSSQVLEMPATQPSEEELVRQGMASGMTKNQICMQVWGSSGGVQYQRIEDIMAS